MADFDLALARYFAGDLDAVERRAFERALADPAHQARFDAAWDARVEADGLLALHAPDPDLKACFSFATLDAYVAERLAPADAALVDAHLACPLCSVQVEGLRAAPAERVESARPSWWARFTASLSRPMILAPLAIGAAALLFFVWRGPVEPIGTLTPRGAPPDWASRVGVTATVSGAPLQDPLASGAPIAITTRNQAAETPTWLMVFGINAANEVDWYYPAWTDAAANPASIVLPPGEVRLPDAVGFDRPPGRYRLVAWFTLAPKTVQAVEAALGRGDLEALDGGHLQVLELRVRP